MSIVRSLRKSHAIERRRSGESPFFFFSLDPRGEAYCAAACFVNLQMSLCMQGSISAAFNAFSCFFDIHRRAHHSRSLVTTISSFLQFFDARFVPEANLLHSLSLRLGCFRDPHILGPLTSFYARNGLLADARSIAASSDDVSSWTALISTHLSVGRDDAALASYSDMIRRGITEEDPDSYLLADCCSEINALILKRVGGDGGDTDDDVVFKNNARMAMHITCGKLRDARKVFDEMPERNAVSYNTMASGYAHRGSGKDDTRQGIWLLMNAGGKELLENPISFNLLLQMSLQMSGPRSVLELSRSVLTRGKGINLMTWHVVLHACAEIGSWRLAKEVHAVAIRTGWAPHGILLYGLVRMYWMCDEIDYSHYLFGMLTRHCKPLSEDYLSAECIFSKLLELPKEHGRKIADEVLDNPYLRDYLCNENDSSFFNNEDVSNIEATPHIFFNNEDISNLEATPHVGMMSNDLLVSNYVNKMNSLAGSDAGRSSEITDG